MSKRKGSAYERELVHKLQDAGLVAQRVPLSGAMAGYPGDIIISDEWTIEAKYSKTGAGFKRLIEWLAPDRPYIRVGDLDVYTLDLWVALELERPDGCVDLALALEPHVIASKSSFSFVCAAFDQGECAADFVACRMPRHDWIMIQRKEKDPQA